MNQLNKSLQGPRENFVTSSDKILGFKRKLNLCKNNVVKGNLEMFSQLLRLESEGGYKQVSSLIENHLAELQNIIKRYVPSVSTEVYDWVRNPYSASPGQPENFVSCSLSVHSR
jgi:hypothetical protein